MTTQKTFSKSEMIVNDLTTFATELKDNGFTVLVSAKHPFKWLYFEKDGKFGEVSPDGYLCYNYGTVHKPCRECGTGYGMARNTGLNLKDAADCLIFAPNWATTKEREAIRKYTSIDDFINSSHNKWAEYYTL